MNYTDIRKWFYFSLNYDYEYYPDYQEYFPRFLMEIDWGCDRMHMINKWKTCQDRDSFARINVFFADVDENCRKKLVEWASENYIG